MQARFPSGICLGFVRLGSGSRHLAEDRQVRDHWMSFFGILWITFTRLKAGGSIVLKSMILYVKLLMLLWLVGLGAVLLSPFLILLTNVWRQRKLDNGGKILVIVPSLTTRYATRKSRT